MKTDLIAEATSQINAPITKVWEALTRPEIIKQYFFGTTTKTDWKVGSPIRFTGEWEGTTYEDKGTILDVQPNKLLSYNYWSSMSGIEDIPENYVNITYSLSQQGATTNLSITQDNVPDDEMKGHSEENWNKVLGNLKRLLEQNDLTI